MEDWHNVDFVKSWDESASRGNPSRENQLSLLITLLSERCQSGDTILDLGIGSAQVEERLFLKRADVNIVGIDHSSAMLEIARERLRKTTLRNTQCVLYHHELADIDTLGFSHNAFSHVIAVQTLHHLEPETQKQIYGRVFDLVKNNGLFLLMDRVNIDGSKLNSVYATTWNWLENQSAIKSGWSGQYFLERLASQHDYPLSVETTVSWLEEAGFQAACLDLTLNRALYVGIKG